jgi:DNA mismatch repair protein MutS
MGARLLRSWVELPLLSVDEINHRQGAVAEWHSRPLERSDMRKLLANIRDLERLMARLLTRAATARDLANLRESLQYLPAVGRILNKLEAPAFVEMQRTYDNLSDICKLLSARIVENPPHSTGEGGMICPGNNQRLDELTHMRDNTAATLAQMEAREREATGIASLKVKSNRVFGYYIEVTTPNLPKVPPHYNRKQTIANGERFTTEELKELEQTILGAEEEINALEYSIFDATRRETLEHMARVQFTAAVLGTLDALQSLGEAAERGGYTRPTVDRGNEINIEDGTHPVLSAGQAGDFVPNSTQIGTAQHCLSIITGPNMSGKSTYMRQVALIVLMAQIGSFVPAKTARIGVRDRIFTRVGASDDIATGRSTFMVEMTEVANILNNATAHSLIILDEVGRGTSTYDGLSIAWAVLEHIAEHIGALTLFATHYHELTKLESHLPGVQNYYFATREKGEDIIFLRKLERGSASRSYGLHVARLAGLPKATLVRAEGLLRKLNKH